MLCPWWYVVPSQDRNNVCLYSPTKLDTEDSRPAGGHGGECVLGVQGQWQAPAVIPLAEEWRASLAPGKQCCWGWGGGDGAHRYRNKKWGQCLESNAASCHYVRESGRMWISASSDAPALHAQHLRFHIHLHSETILVQTWGVCMCVACLVVV